MTAFGCFPNTVKFYFFVDTIKAPTAGALIFDGLSGRLNINNPYQHYEILQAYFYKMKKIFILSLAAFFSFSGFSQTVGKYKYVDEKVQQFGALSTFNVATIADTITAGFSDPEEKARAIFYWITNNISIDPKGTRQNDPKNTLPEKVIELRKATPLGYSLLVQEMCSDAGIRCISVDGYIKRSAAEINEPADGINHSWNVIQLGKSPETWYFTDASRGAGFTDKKMSVFNKEFTSGFFFADRKLFNLASFPDNSAWQLGGGIKSLKDFYILPIIGNYSFDLGLNKPIPALGFIKTKLQKAVSFSFNTSREIKSITIVTGEDKKQSKPETVIFENTNGTVSFNYSFKKEDTFPFKVMADGKIILEYLVEVNE